MGLISVPVLLAVAAIAVAFKLFKYFTSESPSLNPLRNDSRTEIKPKEIDQKKRDAVLKQGNNEISIIYYMDNYSLEEHMFSLHEIIKKS